MRKSGLTGTEVGDSGLLEEEEELAAAVVVVVADA